MALHDDPENYVYDPREPSYNGDSEALSDEVRKHFADLKTSLTEAVALEAVRLEGLIAQRDEVLRQIFTVLTAGREYHEALQQRQQAEINALNETLTELLKALNRE